MNDAWDDLPEPRDVHCKCGYPDMPGQCPGWRSCPMHAEIERYLDDMGVEPVGADA